MVFISGRASEEGAVKTSCTFMEWEEIFLKVTKQVGAHEDRTGHLLFDHLPVPKQEWEHK